MERSEHERRALQAVLERARWDVDFRRRLLTEPHEAIREACGVTIPATFRIKFVERSRDVDALIVLPDVRRPADEVEDALEGAMGGLGGAGIGLAHAALVLER